MLPSGQEDAISAKALQVKGLINRAQGKLPEAIKDLDLARKIFERENDLKAVAYITGELGIVHYYQNEFLLAIENYQRATQACEKMKDLRGAMIGHFNVGDVLIQQGQYQQARSELESAFEIAHKKKLHDSELKIGLYLVEAEISVHNLEKAQNLLNTLQPIIAMQKTLCSSGQAECLQASLFWHQGNTIKATEHFERSFDLLSGDECIYERARANLEYASFMKEHKDINNAQNALKNARRAFIAINNELGVQAAEKALLALDVK